MSEFITPEMHEKCAVVGVSSIEIPASRVAAQALFALQHRGQEGTGLASNNNELSFHTAPGQVRSAYNDDILNAMQGNLAVGHNRYPTSGNPSKHPQPVIDKPAFFAFAHNGNVPEVDTLIDKLDTFNVNPIGMNDSEMMGHLLASMVRSGLTLDEAVRQSYESFTGAFTAVAMQGDLMVAFKDLCGIRPAVLGRLPDNGLIVASETCALEIVDAKVLQELSAGEMVIISNGEYEFEQLAEPNEKIDIFELIYFARPDSILFGQHVSEMRRRLGRELADEHPITGDLVIGIPRSGTFVGEGYADAMQMPHSTALIKNEYTGRSFILADQASRQEEVRYKMNMLPEQVKGRGVVLVDDSLVRGNTLRQVVTLARKHRARSISVLVGSPPVVYPDYYGIDTKTQDELIAANNSLDEVKEFLGCDYLGYLSMDGMLEALEVPASKINLSCFTGEYPICIGNRAQEIRQPKISV